MKIEKIIGIGFFIATISLVGIQLIMYYEPYTHDGHASGVYVEDDIAYIADSFLGLVIMDVSNPSEPYELGRLDQVPQIGSGRHIYFRNQIAYLVRNNKLRLINVSDTSSPSQFSALGVKVDGIHVEFPFFYLFSNSGAFRIYNFSDPLNPSQLGYIDLGGIYDVYVSNNIAYIANQNGMKIIDVSNSSNLIELGQFYTADGYRDCVVDGNIVYAARWYDYIDIIDVSDPTNPTKLSQFYEGASSYWNGIEYLDDTLYVSDASDGLELIDVTNPLNPFKYAQFNLRRNRDAFIKYPYAYVACQDDGLKIVDVSNPSFLDVFPSILNFTITIVSIGVIVSLILLKLRRQKKKM